MNYVPKIKVIEKYGKKIGRKILSQLPKNKKIILVEQYSLKQIRVHLMNYGHKSKRVWVYGFDMNGKYLGGYSGIP